jgi:hypothetical protein
MGLLMENIHISLAPAVIEYLSEHVVIIRDVTGTLPAFYGNGKIYHVELHRRGSGTYGIAGFATVSVLGGMAEFANLIVFDHLRRRGYGRRIIIAPGERWPEMEWSDCPASRPFHDRLVEQGIAERASDGRLRLAR